MHSSISNFYLSYIEKSHFTSNITGTDSRFNFNNLNDEDEVKLQFNFVIIKFFFFIFVLLIINIFVFYVYFFFIIPIIIIIIIPIIILIILLITILIVRIYFEMIGIPVDASRQPKMRKCWNRIGFFTGSQNDPRISTSIRYRLFSWIVLT